jgi:endonuclease YncB( thermonuclease family)
VAGKKLASKPQGNVLSARQYARLLGDVASIIEQARERAEQAAANLLVAAYHKVGKRIEREKVTQRAGYGDHLLDSLATDLAIDKRTLERACLFSRVYAAPPKLGLNWAHYRELLKLKDPGERSFYEKLAAREHLSSSALVSAISSDSFAHHDPKALPAPKLARPKATSFLYAVTVERVVDGDTLVATVDLGFRIRAELRVRLAHVNAAPAKSREGRAATRFVVEELARASSVALQTEWPDLHGRYVGHVFYARRALSPAETARRGSYLNQKLLQEGHGSLA